MTSASLYEASFSDIYKHVVKNIVKTEAALTLSKIFLNILILFLIQETYYEWFYPRWKSFLWSTDTDRYDIQTWLQPQK